MKPTIEDVAKWHEEQADIAFGPLSYAHHTDAAKVLREAMGEIERLAKDPEAYDLKGDDLINSALTALREIARVAARALTKGTSDAE